MKKQGCQGGMFLLFFNVCLRFITYNSSCKILHEIQNTRVEIVANYFNIKKKLLLYKLQIIFSKQI